MKKIKDFDAANNWLTLNPAQLAVTDGHQWLISLSPMEKCEMKASLSGEMTSLRATLVSVDEKSQNQPEL